MRRSALFLCYLALYASAASTSTTPMSSPIKNVVVLMFENRSFDHMLGYLKALDPRIEGLTGTEANYLDPNDPTSTKYTVDPFAPYVHPAADPDHGVHGTFLELFGQQDHIVDPAPMSGFALREHQKQHGAGQTVMSCFNHTSVPIISTLAQEFAVFDKWYASVPGPTEVNRMFVNSATSYGDSDNNVTHIIEGYPQKPIQVALEEAGATWKVYMEQISCTLAFSQLRTLERLEKYAGILNFLEDAKTGSLPNFSFIDPIYFPMLDIPASDQHPSHSVAEGEKVMKMVYEALRASPQWNSTLLIVTYDEHGGFYDHHPTPLSVPNPDGRSSQEFDFTRIGIRIPTIMISPWIEKGTVVHEATGPTPTSQYEHSSIPATLKKMFGTSAFLTKRDEWAGTFESVFSTRTTPRTDCPETLPPVPGLLSAAEVAAEGDKPPTDLQISFMQMAAALRGANLSAEDILAKAPTQFIAGQLTDKLVKGFFRKVRRTARQQQA